MLAKAQRYTELACLMFDLHMLVDVFSLRITCKSNSVRRRFPMNNINTDRYEELEANIIEEFIGYGSSRFVSTAVIYALISIHNSPARTTIIGSG